MLKINPCAKNYAELAKLALAQVLIFSRRREGEVSRMELATFIGRNASKLNEDMATCLSPLENKMCDFFTRVEIGENIVEESLCSSNPPWSHQWNSWLKAEKNVAS